MRHGAPCGRIWWPWPLLHSFCSLSAPGDSENRRRGNMSKKNSKKATDEPKEKMSRKDYEKALEELQVELCRLQEWVKRKGERVIVVFEGRDAAGKGGLIKAITERVSPRVFRVVALPAPSDREKTQVFLQRYIKEFPA